MPRTRASKPWPAAAALSSFAMPRLLPVCVPYRMSRLLLAAAGEDTSAAAEAAPAVASAASALASSA